MKKRAPFSSLLKTVNVSNDIETFSYDKHSITLNIANRQLVIVSKILVHKLVMFYKPFCSVFSIPVFIFFFPFIQICDTIFPLFREVFLCLTSP